MFLEALLHLSFSGGASSSFLPFVLLEHKLSACKPVHYSPPQDIPATIPAATTLGSTRCLDGECQNMSV